MRYGTDDRQFVDLVGTARNASCVLLVHGGFWRAEKNSESLWPAVSALAEEHGTVGSIEYRTADAGGAWPICRNDVIAAVRAVWQQSDVTSGETVLVGHSAGGQLALTAAAELPQLRAVVGAAAVSDLVAAAPDRLGDDAVTVLFGGAQASPDQLAAASPWHLQPPPCRVELIHGTADQAVPVDYSRRLAARWSDADVHLSVIEGARHMHLVNPQRPAWTTLTQRLRLVSSLGAA